MHGAPSNLEELRELLATARTRREPLPALELGAFNRVVEYQPQDLTIRVEAGMTLAALQACLGRRGQWLPLDPPGAERMTIAGLLNEDASGPHRFGFGTVREHLLGLKVALADGQVIKSGGKVVKNVAGYDLQKLFVGSRGTLGVIVEATFKVAPLPERESVLAADCPTPEEAARLIEAVLNSELNPVVLDLHNLSPHPQASDAPAAAASAGRAEEGPPADPLATDHLPVLQLAFAGTEEAVAWQVSRAAELCHTQAGSLDYEQEFRANAGRGGVHRLSVLPSRLTDALRGLRCERYVARAGNGVIYYAGGKPPPKLDLPVVLMRRVKDLFDPQHILPELIL